MCSPLGIPLVITGPGSVSSMVVSAINLPPEISATTTCNLYSRPADSKIGPNDQLTGCEDSGSPDTETWPSRIRSPLS